MVDGFSGIMLWLEVQEGKERMRKKEFQDLGGTAACTMRGVLSTDDYEESLELETNEDLNKKRCYYGDSWFGSVKTAANISRAGHHAVMMVKTAFSRSPKKWLEEKMKDMPGGVWIVLEGIAEKEDVPVVCIGYKYNRKKVLTFVMTKGAGTTASGRPYEARFPDKYGNVCVRHVMRPDVIANYFRFSNVVDVHNQARQYELALEKKWVTQDGYFRLFTTFLGMNITDAWKTFRTNHKTSLRDIGITQFADILAEEMMEYAEEIDEDYDIICNTSATSSEISSLHNVTVSIQGSTHTRQFLAKGKQLRCIWCSRVHLIERKTTLKCIECGYGFCRNECWEHHQRLGSPPAASRRGERKRKMNEND